MRVRGFQRRVDARGAYLMMLAGTLAYYAGQIIFQPTFATQQGLEPIAALLPMHAIGWVCMTVAALTAAAGVVRRRWAWADRWGFALATGPPLLWVFAFAWSWISRGCEGYPLGGTWAFYAMGITIANIKLDRGRTTEEHDARWSGRWIGAWDSDRDDRSDRRGLPGEGGGTTGGPDVVP